MDNDQKFWLSVWSLVATVVVSILEAERRAEQRVRAEIARDYASVGLAAANAAAWRPLTDQPPSERVLIMSRHGAAVAQWDAKIDGWRNDDTMYSPRYFTHWQPLPAPPVNSDVLGGRDGHN